jgi:hypothetical protein
VQFWAFEYQVLQALDLEVSHTKLELAAVTGLKPGTCSQGCRQLKALGYARRGRRRMVTYAGEGKRRRFPYAAWFLTRAGATARVEATVRPYIRKTGPLAEARRRVLESGDDAAWAPAKEEGP